MRPTLQVGVLLTSPGLCAQIGHRHMRPGAVRWYHPLISFPSILGHERGQLALDWIDVIIAPFSLKDYNLLAGYLITDFPIVVGFGRVDQDFSGLRTYSQQSSDV
jgi:hypothetical protein